MSPIIYALISVLLVSLISLLGIVTLWFRSKDFQRLLIVLVSFSVGALFGDSFFHLIPEGYEQIGETSSIGIILGIAIFFVLEKFLHWRHCHISPEVHDDHIHPLATINIVGDAIHNILDGMMIAASYLIDLNIGVATTLAVMMHEIPQELGDFGVLLYTGMTPRRALMWNFFSALSAFIGVGIVFLMRENQDWILWLMPITAGGFIYIAGSDLIPELKHETDFKTSLIQLLSILLGMGVMGYLA